MGQKTKAAIFIGMVLLIAGYFGLKAYAAHVAEKNINRSVDRVDAFIDLDYQKVSVDLFGLTTHIKDVRLAGVSSQRALNIDDITIYQASRPDRVPSTLHVRFNGINIDLDQMGEPAALFKQMGYSAIAADTELNYTYNAAQSTLTMHEFQTGAVDIGDIRLACEIGHINLNPSNLPLLLFTFPRITLKQATCTYQDHSFVKRLLELAAEKAGQADEMFMKDLNARLDKEIARRSNPHLKQVLTAFKQFVNDPEAITLSILPDEPVSIGRLQKIQDRDELIKLLNVRAYAN